MSPTSADVHVARCAGIQALGNGMHVEQSLHGPQTSGTLASLGHCSCSLPGLLQAAARAAVFSKA